MTIRKKACKAFARSLAAAMAQQVEICWQQENHDITDEEVDYIAQEMKRVVQRIEKTIDYVALADIKPTCGYDDFHRRVRK